MIDACTEGIAGHVPRRPEVVLRADPPPIAPAQAGASTGREQIGAERGAVDVPAGARRRRAHRDLELGRQRCERAGADDRVTTREDAADRVHGGSAEQRTVDELAAELGAAGSWAHDEAGRGRAVDEQHQAGRKGARAYSAPTRRVARVVDADAQV